MYKKPTIFIYPFLASNQSNVHAKNDSLMQQIVDSSKYFLGQKYHFQKQIFLFSFKPKQMFSFLPKGSRSKQKSVFIFLI